MENDLNPVKYCKRCLYPNTSAHPLVLDDEGICSGCRVSEEIDEIDWGTRREAFREILEEYKSKDGSNYDCIIPASGGKDSTYQTYIIKEIFKLNPLVVTFNHGFNTKIGLQNLENIRKQFGVDHIRFTPSPTITRKLARKTLKMIGDPCWHCHTGINVFPVQVAVRYNIPLIIWGEQGLLNLAGSYSLHDMIEMTRKVQKEHAQRGCEWSDMIDNEENITRQDLQWAIYPSDEDIQRVGVRGVFMGNYFPWNQKKQTEFLIEKYGFKTGPQERTYNTYENCECHHCGGVHDYLKFIKFGYGRATDHASLDIRWGRLNRQQAIALACHYDKKRPKDLDIFLKYINMTEDEFMEIANKFRDPKIWTKDKDGNWYMKTELDPDFPGEDAEKIQEIEKSLNYIKNWKQEDIDDEYHLG